MTRRALTLSAALLAAFCVSPSLVVADPVGVVSVITVSGFVRDRAGQGLSRAVVLLTPLGGAGAVLSTLTDLDGRYLFEGMASGHYRVTGLKNGYATGVGRVSTWLGQGVDLILAPAGDNPPYPRRMDWVLTAPPRDILRDLEPIVIAGAVPVEGSTGGAALPGPAADPQTPAHLPFGAVQGEIRQLFSEAQAASSDASAITGGSGSTTSLSVGSPIGSSAAWEFLGLRDRQSTTWKDALLRERQITAQRLQVNFRSSTGGDGRLGMRAYYDHDDLAFDTDSTGPQVAGVDPDLERRAWGYEADWSGTVGSATSVEVDMHYVGSEVGSPGGRLDRREGGPAESLDETDAGTDVLRTSAHLSRRIGSRHNLGVGVRARIYSFGESNGQRIAPSPGQDPDLFTEFGQNGWTVSVSAAESWALMGPLALDMGFDLSRSVGATGAMRESVVPQAGVTFISGDATTMRGLVSYVASTRERAVAGSAEIPVESTRSSIGYRVQIEQRIGKRLVLALDAESSPFFFDAIGGRWNSAMTSQAGRSLYMSDGGAGVRQVSVALEGKPRPTLRLGLGASAGHVSGLVAASLPDGALLRTLAEGDIRYVVARLGGSSERTGTEFRVDVIRLGSRSESSGDLERYEDRRVALQILQSLAFLRPAETEWSVMLDVDSVLPQRTGAEPSAERARLEAPRNRFSGGVSIKF